MSKKENLSILVNDKPIGDIPSSDGFPWAAVFIILIAILFILGLSGLGWYMLSSMNSLTN